MFFNLLFLLVGATIAVAKVQFMGINLAGFDFGCSIDGACSLGSAQSPSDASGQITHFVNDDQMNVFRFPVSWQFLTNNKVGGTLDADKLGQYDQVMQTCLATGAHCAIDIHNFARVDGKIIGQGGPSNEQFADLWTQLATKYKSNDKVIFGLMNEPHDVDINVWANTVQAAVTAIRNAGATSQLILMPGNNFASAGQFVPNGSGAALLKVVNPDGSTTGLIMDLHKYLDEDNSGEHSTCTTDNINDAFAVVAAFLRENGRLGLVSETGAGSDASCFTNFCAQNTFLNQNSDVFLGYIAWAAGSFDTSYVLSLTPTKQDGKYVDNALASQCVVAPFLNAGAATAAPVAASATVSPTTTITQISTTTRYTTISSVTTVVGTTTNTLDTTLAPSAVSASTSASSTFLTTTLGLVSGNQTATAGVAGGTGTTSSPFQTQSVLPNLGSRGSAPGLLAGWLVIIAVFL